MSSLRTSPAPARQAAVQAQVARGIELHRVGRVPEALEAFERGVALAPSNPQAQLHAGVINLQLRRWARGVAHLRVAVAADPALAEGWTNLAFGWRELHRIDDAHAAIERAVALQPSLADAWNLLGVITQDRGFPEEAMAHLRRALELRPGFALAQMNLANSDQALGRLDDAIEGYRRALAMDPRLPEVHYNLGHLYHKTGRVEESIGRYRAAIAAQPDYPLAHLNLSHVLFLTGHFDEAWRENAWREPRMTHAAALRSAGREYRLPSPAQAAGAHIAILGEQGLGDVLFYLRFAPLLRARGARLDLHGDTRLVGMLARTGLFERIVVKPTLQEVPPAFEVLAGDLPLVASGTGNALPPPLRLTPEDARLEAMRARLAAFGPPPYIALAWRAGVPKTGLLETLFKEVPVGPLGAALASVRATFVSVQREPVAAEVAELAARLRQPVHDLSSANEDLEDALAAMALVDDYVGVSSTNVHLRAATGGHGRILVPFPPEWRWMAKGDSPWFPGFEVLRQDGARRWDGALERLAAGLAL